MSIRHDEGRCQGPLLCAECAWERDEEAAIMAAEAEPDCECGDADCPWC